MSNKRILRYFNAKSSKEELKLYRRQLAKKYHGDMYTDEKQKIKAESILKEINEEYDYIIKNYDKLNAEPIEDASPVPDRKNVRTPTMRQARLIYACLNTGDVEKLFQVLAGIKNYPQVYLDYGNIYGRDLLRDFADNVSLPNLVKVVNVLASQKRPNPAAGSQVFNHVIDFIGKIFKQ
jgi:hypothetical protein